MKTGRNGSAEIMFADGTLYTLRPGSLFEVHRPSLTESAGSQVKIVSGVINVYTAGSTSKVSTDAATADVDRDSRAALDVEKGEKTEITNFRGKTTVSTGRQTVVLSERERVAAGAKTGEISAKIALPEAPQPLLPADNRIYDLKTGDQVDLRWAAVPAAARYRLQISRSRLFVPDAIEVDLDHRTETYAVVKVSREGAYFWRVATIDKDGVSSDWSAVRRFKMLAELPKAGANAAAAAAPGLTAAADGKSLPRLRQDGSRGDRHRQRRDGRRGRRRLVPKNHHRSNGTAMRCSS